MKSLSPEVDRIVGEQKAQNAVKAEYKAKEKVKKLTDKERIDRIEKMLGLNEPEKQP